MKQIRPVTKGTICSNDLREWVPASLEDFLLELAHIENACEKDSPCCLFRGQADCNWQLDSTFVRSAVKRILNISDCRNLIPRVRNTVAFNRALIALLLLKKELYRPSEELFLREKDSGIDLWYEILRNLQQNPIKDTKDIPGTILLDWTDLKETALYFTVFSDRDIDVTQGNGAMWVFDAGATGRIHQEIALEKIFSMKDFIDGEKSLLPLLIHPKKQSRHQLAIDQGAIYISQMDFRRDLAEVWAQYEQLHERKVFVKLVLKEGLKSSAAEYLRKKGITRETIFP